MHHLKMGNNWWKTSYPFKTKQKTLIPSILSNDSISPQLLINPLQNRYIPQIFKILF